MAINTWVAQQMDNGLKENEKTMTQKQMHDSEKTWNNVYYVTHLRGILKKTIVRKYHSYIPAKILGSFYQKKRQCDLSLDGYITNNPYLIHSDHRGWTTMEPPAERRNMLKPTVKEASTESQGEWFQMPEDANQLFKMLGD